MKKCFNVEICACVSKFKAFLQFATTRLGLVGAIREGNVKKCIGIFENN